MSASVPGAALSAIWMPSGPLTIKNACFFKEKQALQGTEKAKPGKPCFFGNPAVLPAAMA
jgi:hypothetical protein